MNEERRNVPNIGDEFADGDERAAVDSGSFTEGVGGVPDIEDETRATVSDVDGDNVEPDPERRPEV